MKTRQTAVAWGLCASLAACQSAAHPTVPAHLTSVAPTAKPVGLLLASAAPDAKASPLASPSAGVGASVAPLASPAIAALATLTGTVRLPQAFASIIANNGGALISNNSGSLISDSGGGFRLLDAPTQVLAANAQVQVLDAKNQPVLGPDGKPLFTTTAADGSFSITAVLPAQNLVLAVPLTGQAGQALAIVAPAATGPRQAAIDVVSTLTTGYILDQFVKGQPDPVATLEKLPAAVNAATQSAAAAAVANGGTLPATLATTAVVQAVQTLRQHDTSFDAQMDTVRKLLIPAGQSDLGAGLAATEVALSSIPAMAVAPNGTLYFSEAAQHRVWQLAADGTLVTAAGSGTTSTASLDGLAGPAAGLGTVVGLAFDATGRLLMLDRADDGTTRLSRLETTGLLTQLAGGLTGGLGVVPGDNGAVWVFLTGAAGPELWSIGADKTKTQLEAFAGADVTALKQATTFGRISGGHVLIGLAEGSSSETSASVLSYDPGAKTLTPMFTAGTSVVVGVDPAGSLVQGGTSTNILPAAGGAPKPLLAHGNPDILTRSLKANPFSGDPGHLFVTALAPDGSAYLALSPSTGHTVVYKAANDVLTAVAGKTGTSTSAASDLGLLQPAGVAAGPNGSFYVLDLGKHDILQVAADKTVTVLDVPNPPTAGTLRVDAHGLLYYPLGQSIACLHPTGLTYAAVTYGSDFVNNVPLRDFVIGADNTVHTLPDPKAVLAVDATHAFGMAIEASGAIDIVGNGLLQQWSSASGLHTVATDARFTLGANDTSNVAVDKTGRILFTSAAANTVTRYDPTAKTFTVLAGPSGTLFSGSGVDDGLSSPGYPAFDVDGSLLFSDTGHKQVKRVPVGSL